MVRTILFSLITTLATAGTAAAEPAFCQAVPDRLEHTTVKDALGADPSWAIYSLVGSSCHVRAETEEARRQPEIEAARKRWSKRLGMTEADWADAAAWAAEPQHKRMSTSIEVAPKKAYSAMTPIEQFAAIRSADDEAPYVTDAFGARLGEVGRFAYILACFGSSKEIVDWALCQPDLEQLDRAKFAAELRASTTSTGYERMALRLALDGYEPQRAEHAAQVAKAVAADPAYPQVFAAAAAARKAYAPDAKLVDLALAMDDARIAGSRKAYADCRARTWSALGAAVSAIPAKRFAGIRAEPGGPSVVEQAAGVIASDANGYLAALAYATCTSADKDRDYLTRELAGSLQRWPGFRGPRTASLTAIMMAGIELDDRDAKLAYPTTVHDWLRAPTGGRGGGQGVIASIKTTGPTAVITFAKKLEQQRVCTSEKTTNRIVQILSDGRLVYESICVAEKTVTVDTASPPQTVNAQYLAGLAPGMTVTIAEDVVVIGWKKGAKQPAVIAGVVVK